MTTPFIAGLLSLDAVLIEVARRRASRSVPEVILWYGAFVSVSGVLVAWNHLDPGPLPFNLGLGWLFVTSIPAILIASVSKPRRRDVSGLAGLREGVKDPLKVTPTGAEAKALEAAGIALDSIRAAARTDLSFDGNYARGLAVVTAETVACVAPDGRVVALPLAGMKGLGAELQVGGGRLEAKAPGGRVTVMARYTNASARAVGTLAKRVNDYLEARDALKEYEEKAARKKLEEGKDKPEEGKDKPDEGKGKSDEGKDKRPDDPKLDFANHDVKDKRCPKCGFRIEENTDVCPRCVKRTRVIVRLLRYSRPYIGWLAATMVLFFIGTALSLTPPYLSKMLFDKVLITGPNAGGDKLHTLMLLILGLGGVYLVQSLNGAIGGRISVFYGSIVVRDLRAMVFNHLQMLSLGFFNKREVGALMARLSNDVNWVEILMVDGIRFTVINTLLVGGISVMLLAMNWKLGLLALLPAPMLLAFSVWFWSRVEGMFGRRWEMYSRLSSFLNDSLGGVRVVKAFGKEAQEIKRFNVRNADLYNAGVNAELMWATYSPALGILMQGGTLLVWYFGGRLVLGAEITPGTLVAFTGYLGMLYGPMMMLTQINNFLTSSFSATERVFEILDAKPDVKDAPDAVELPRIAGSVELREVTFGYDPLKPVIKKISLDVKPGEMVGLVGHSGAGKSTTINLICRLYDVQEGGIFIDGMDIRKVKQESLRRQVGIVLQDTYLFNGTIAENIAYSHPEATIEEVISAAVTARAHDFIMTKPDGYDTMVGDRGGNLSGGEKQRIAIARAILHNPRLLILDEATSSVDTMTEQEIQKALINLMKDRTTFAIAHRLSTLQRASRLVVLEKGKVAEVGTHAELVAKKGLYAKLAEAQAESKKTVVEVVV